jgi:hypothetical protein
MQIRHLTLSCNSDRQLTVGGSYLAICPPRELQIRRLREWIPISEASAAVVAGLAFGEAFDE